MNQKSRTKNAMLNIAFGYVAQIGIFILSFVGRRIFLTFLSTDYLGINGLYSNILTILSLAELGLDTAVVYSLYKPVAENNTVLIRSLLKFFKKVYYSLAIIIFMIGIALIPFLKFIINSNLDNRELILYFLVFLTNTVASYFVAHKVALLSACQEQRVQKLITLSTNFVLQIINIVVLLITHSYMVYIIAMLCVTVISNIILSSVCTKIHSEIFNGEEIVDFEKQPIVERVISTFLYKIGAVLINSTDNILISILVSTAAVGFYSNYYTIVSAIQGFITIITTSLISGIGNYAVTNDNKGQKGLFYFLLLFYHTVAGIGLVGFSLLFNDFISIWLGSQYVFDMKTVYIISINFYLTTAISPVWMFREANGLFSKVKFLLLIRAFFNIVFSVILGIKFGVFGIFVATAISLILTNFWYEPKVLFNNVMGCNSKGYWIRQFKYFLITVFAFLLSYILTNYIGNGLISLAIKAILVVFITGGLFILFNLKTDEIKKGLSFFRVK